MLPSNSEYVTIVKNMQVFIKDDYLKDGKPIPKGASLLSYTGGFSKVFPVNIGKEKVALRFWTKEIGESKERYREIDSYLKKKRLSYFVGFHYIEDKLNWKNNQYPFIYMDWVTGVPLGQYLNKNISNHHKIKNLSKHFLEMVKTLHQNSIAHGDLQDENILIINNGSDIELKLIDYDTMFVPKLKNFDIDIMGVEAYQHPKKNSTKKINEKIDYFSELVIYLSLLAYAEDSSLWDATTKRQLLFKEKDFKNPLKSKIFKHLKDKRYSSTIHDLTENLIEFCQEINILRLQPLEELLPIEFDDKDIAEAYQEFVDLSIGNSKRVFDEIVDYWNMHQGTRGAKTKILKYLYFLSNQDEYLLPNNYQKLLDDEDFSFIENIYKFYSIDELEKIGRKISLDNIVNLAKDDSFEEQKRIQKLYYLKSRILPKDFILTLGNDFFGTLKKIDSYIRKDILEKTLKRSIVSDNKSSQYITNLQNSSSLEYGKELDNIIENVKREYILPIDYQSLIIDKSLSLNYIIPNFYTVNEIEKRAKDVSVDNMVSQMRRGSFKVQKSIEELDNLKDRYMPKDFNKALEFNLFHAIYSIDDTINNGTRDRYIRKNELNSMLQKSKLSQDERQQQIDTLKNSTIENYDKTLEKVEHEIAKDPKFEKMFMELELAKYSEVVQKYLDKFWKKSAYLKKNDYKIVEFLDSQIKKTKIIRISYLMINLSFFIGIFFLSYKSEWLLPILSISTTLFYIVNINRVNTIPKKFQLRITGQIKPKNIRIFSKKIWVVDIILICIIATLVSFVPLLYQDYLPLLIEIV